MVAIVNLKIKSIPKNMNDVYFSLLKGVSPFIERFGAEQTKKTSYDNVLFLHILTQEP